MQETLDFLSPRVALSALAGGTGGLTLASLRGYHFPARTAGLSAASCAAVATACFGVERVAHAALSNLAPAPIMGDNRDWMRYASHAAGGLLGGSLMGVLYIRKPIRGALFFTPIMLAAALFDKKFTNYRQGKHEQIREQKEKDMQQQEQQQQQQSNKAME